MIRGLFLTITLTLCMVGGVYCQEEAEVEDAEVIEMLDLLDRLEMLDDKDFEMLEEVIRIGETDES